MHPSHEEILDRWLAAEHEGRDDAAETALLALFEALPPLVPPAGFADRVLARAGVVAAVPARRSLFASYGLRALVTLSLLVTGLALPWLSEVLRSVAGLTRAWWSAGDVVRLGAGALVATSQALATALAFWDWLLEIGRVLALPFATPAVTVVLFGCLLVSLVAFHFLRDLITRDRSWIHVEPI
ncbi:MAG TPA: hypothetical protein VEW48_17475 [Thermoanaerobaculia bacterium]|nr:hypothetical protein [Thermoanaerobaculia bacterium]